MSINDAIIHIIVTNNKYSYLSAFNTRSKKVVVDKGLPGSESEHEGEFESDGNIQNMDPGTLSRKRGNNVLSESNESGESSTEKVQKLESDMMEMRQEMKDIKSILDTLVEKKEEEKEGKAEKNKVFQWQDLKNKLSDEEFLEWEEKLDNEDSREELVSYFIYFA